DLVGLHLLLGVHERPPARQVLAVEELDPAVAFVVGWRAGGEHDEGQPSEAGGGKSAAVHVRTPCCQGTGTKRILGRKPSGRMGSARTDLPTDGANSHAGGAGVGSAAVGPYSPDASGAWLGSWCRMVGLALGTSVTAFLRSERFARVGLIDRGLIDRVPPN